MSENFNRIMAGLTEAVEISSGRAESARVSSPDVKAVRKRLGMTQEEFAGRFGVPKATVADWEQGRRSPAGAARTLLTVIDKEPEAVERALAL